MTWAILGDIEFELTDSPQGVEHHFAAEFAQHPLISKKPRLEAIGGALDELTLDILLHYRLGDVPERLRRLREALAAQEPLTLVMGDGDYRGPWVLTDGVTTWTKTAPDGRLLIATLKLSLLEYTGQFERPTPAPGIAKELIKPGTLTLPPRVATAAQRVAGLARTVENAVRQAANVAGDALALIDSPRAAMRAAPAFGTAIGQALAASRALQQTAAVDAFAGFARLGADLAQDVSAARHALSPPTLSTIGNQWRLATERLEQGLGRLEAARLPVLRLTAATAIRRA